MFGNQNYGGQNNNNGVNVNTSIKTFFSDYSSMSLGAWNNQISIKLVPCIGTDANGMRQYDQNRRASTALVPEKALPLKKGIDNVIIPALNAIMNGEPFGEPRSVSVSMGTAAKRSILSIELKEDEGGKPSVYMTVCQMVKEDNSTDPQNIFIYKFGSTTLVYDYNPQNGSVGKEVDVDSEFEVFYEILKSVVNILPLSAHGAKYSNAVSSRFSSTGNATSGYQRPATPQMPAPTYDAPVSAYTSMEDLGLPFN